MRLRIKNNNILTPFSGKCNNFPSHDNNPALSHPCRSSFGDPSPVFPHKPPNLYFLWLFSVPMPNLTQHKQHFSTSINQIFPIFLQTSVGVVSLMLKEFGWRPRAAKSNLGGWERAVKPEPRLKPIVGCDFQSTQMDLGLFFSAPHLCMALIINPK